MKITKLETIRIDKFPNICYVQIHTDEGLIGLGETYFAAEAVESWIHETGAGVLLGQDPLTIDCHWNAMVGFVGSRSTGIENRGRSALDIALWDIFGKVTNQPIYQLLGGAFRESIPLYNTCAGPHYTQGKPKNGGLPVDNWGIGKSANLEPYNDLDAFMNNADELAESLISEGFMGMKIWPFDPYAEASGGHYISNENLKKALIPFEKIRKRVGDKIEIMVEMHSKWDVRTAKQIANALEEYNPFWYEDPIKMDNLDALSGLSESINIPIAASETLGTRWAYRELLERKATDVLIFDPTWTGGISEGKRIATLAEIYQIPIATHDCVGPLSFVVDVHLSINASNAFVQEAVRSFYYGWYQELLTELPLIKEGRVYPLQGPGLGTSLRPEVFERSDFHRRESIIE
ncbi:mandelate racemase/muconate lactonizing enzyme family protein [Bacillus sp. FJAT-29790]|uniref:mandelate racemase/muconate lactonizing enzyme family protein n=1 Tax=Bacillus sp. FJAT-29790 TaxID=1895002 RepID=UPI001C21DC0D|nr:mandelate racemase/muconate lactonizing enzyme family protein [Bacillus sp. FJAT-29790]MBU8879925.1 mandelate racemase/muconate lactonizing enzyme family protein [Bacillus sp. FJAT-29790]